MVHGSVSPFVHRKTSAVLSPSLKSAMASTAEVDKATFRPLTGLWRMPRRTGIWAS